MGLIAPAMDRLCPLRLMIDGCARSANAPRAPQRNGQQHTKELYTDPDLMLRKRRSWRGEEKGRADHLRACRRSIALAALVIVGCRLRCSYVQITVRRASGESSSRSSGRQWNVAALHTPCYAQALAASPKFPGGTSKLVHSILLCG